MASVFALRATPRQGGQRTEVRDYPVGAAFSRDSNDFYDSPLTVHHLRFQQLNKSMKRIVQKSKNFREAEEWDILQHIRMTPKERQDAAAELRKRVYGKDAPDVREAHRRT